MLNTNISVLITSKCTLNCEFCSSGIPYHTKQRHIPVEEVVLQVKQALDIYKNAGVYVTHLDLLGGEPLLHPELLDIIRGVYQYRDMFHELRILTNGTLIPDETLLKGIQKLDQTMKVFFIVSNYGQLSARFDRICALLEERGINYRVDEYSGDDQYFGGWVSYGQDGIVQGTTEARFRGCAFCHSGVAEIFDGKLFPCVRTLALHTTGREVLPEDEYIVLQDSLEINTKKLSSFMKREVPFSCCEHCTGLNKSAKRYPAARQVL